MKTYISFYPALLSIIALLFSSSISLDNQIKNKKMSIHEFKVESITGETYDFSNLKGKKVMIVNTASKCGLTPQYEQLEALYQKYKNKDFVIVGFPSNDFMGQEPGTNEEIVSFCKKNYGVTFPLMSKVKVKGKGICDVYSFLTNKAKNGLEDNKVQWNFQKYLLDESGFLVKVISPRITPDDAQISEWIEGS
ncbi:glutathione peroxidase [Crocinitomicaceae bacterium]|nr:glutathione peroxidase [Crocinitomicaceae bacterium]